MDESKTLNLDPERRPISLIELYLLLSELNSDHKLYLGNE